MFVEQMTVLRMSLIPYPGIRTDRKDLEAAVSGIIVCSLHQQAGDALSFMPLVSVGMVDGQHLPTHGKMEFAYWLTALNDPHAPVFVSGFNPHLAR